MSKTRNRVYAHVKQDRLVVEGAESATPWSGSTDVSALTTAVNHREGSSALSFAKSGTTEAFGQITRTLDADKQIDLVEYLRGKLRYWINLSSLTNIASVQLIIGESASHNYVYTTLDSALSTGWNEISVDVDSPSSTTGNGAAWSSIGYIAIKVNFDAAGNTLTDILVDAISAQYELNTKVESVNLSGTGLATSAKQDTGNTSLSSIDTKLSSQATAAKQDTIIGHVDGLETVLGTTSDAAVSTDTNGTVSGKLRGLVKIFADVWNSTVHFLSVGMANKIWGEDSDHDVLKVEGQFIYTNITTATTTTVKSGEGFLHAVVVNKPVIASVITMYDNIAGSGSLIGTRTMGAAVTGADAMAIPYNVKFSIGLTIVTSAATDLTIVTRP